MKLCNFFHLCSAALLLIALQAVALGCSCIRKSPVCEAFGGSRAVFVGKVIGAKEQRQERNRDGTSSTFQVGEIYFRVEQSFVGVRGSQVVIHSGTGGGDCGYWFVKGERYLVYAYGESQHLMTNICTRTRPLAEADEDLKFLTTLPRPGSGVRIYGTVVAALKDPKSPDWRTPKPLSGVTVKVVGQRTIDAVTGADGAYELTGLPAGNYTVYAEVPDYYHRDPSLKRRVELVDRGCAELDFIAQNKSQLTGRVITLEGMGLARARVQLVPVDAEPTRLGGDVSFSDKNGRFSLERIAPGQYHLGVNLASSPDRDAPFPPTFYPGTTDRSKAMVIEISLGGETSDLEIRMPPRVTEYKVRGFVVWADGTPAANVEVHLEDVNYPGWCVDNCEAETDAQGLFELTGYSGVSYRVVSTADQRVAAKKTEPIHGISDSFVVAGDLEGLKIILAKPGYPWDDKTPKRNEAAPPGRK